MHMNPTQPSVAEYCARMQSGESSCKSGVPAKQSGVAAGRKELSYRNDIARVSNAEAGASSKDEPSVAHDPLRNHRRAATQLGDSGVL